MVPEYGKVWYDDKSKADILSLTNLVKKYRFTYESHQDYTFTAHTNRGIINSRTNKQGKCFFNPTYTTENYNVVTTAEENMLVFIGRKIERTKLDINIYINVGIKM